MATSDDLSKAKESLALLSSLLETPKTENANVRLSGIENANVKISGQDRIQVEFKIEDLIKRLVPEGSISSSCGGCNGCTGCSM